MNPIAYLFTGHRLRAKSWASYRVDWTINVLAALLHDGSTLLLLSVIFSNIRQLKGWSFNEILLIWGFAVISRNLGSVFFDGPTMIKSFIRRGTLDRVLVRPQPLLVQIAAESGINVYGIGRTIVGIAAILYVLPELTLPWWSAIYLPAAILCSVVLYFCMQLTIVCISFWFNEAFSLLVAINWMSQFGQYPVEIFALPLQFLFTWVLPYAMMGFFPAAFLLRSGGYIFYGLFLPVLAAIFLGFAAIAWRMAIRHYTSTGS